MLTALQGTRTDTDDLLTSAYCLGCQALVGYLITSLSPDPTLPTYFRLLKYASSPTASLPTHAGSPSSLDGAATLRQYSLSTHLTAEMLEIGQAHACHRFIVEDVETETARLLVRALPAVSVLIRLAVALQSGCPRLALGQWQLKSHAQRS